MWLLQTPPPTSEFQMVIPTSMAFSLSSHRLCEHGWKAEHADKDHYVSWGTQKAGKRGWDPNLMPTCCILPCCAFLHWDHSFRVGKHFCRSVDIDHQFSFLHFHFVHCAKQMLECASRYRFADSIFNHPRKSYDSILPGHIFSLLTLCAAARCAPVFETCHWGVRSFQTAPLWNQNSWNFWRHSVSVKEAVAVPCNW